MRKLERPNTMNQVPKPKNATLRILSAPTRAIVERLHVFIPHNRRVSHVAVGSIIMICGASLATAGHAVFHEYRLLEIVGDSVCYGLHGLGAAPIIKVICERFNVDV